MRLVRIRRWVASLAWRVAPLLARLRRRDALGRLALRSHDYRHLTQIIGVRMTELCRDRARSRWLRLHPAQATARDDASAGSA